MKNDSSDLIGGDTRRTDEADANEGIQTKGNTRNGKAKHRQGM
eukprot:CAMPEP_0201920626 /NCGR_PEP_ID=MMETSP0903-20130614/9196_1 /ASSEMBLY_ACC=CAM_ASM_000552 /TAXON_ID=420261 /ORGANISM="Thalassiosira antarctica, Strain CCMP982" /LENGTH=42 /DNA_ID= /DNA_START= /DNA_END= /DNA_ORIENTATION=